MYKNTASQKIAFFSFDYTTGAPKTGDAGNMTAYVDIDWAGVNVLGDTSATEIDSTNAKGWYLFDVTQGETNGNTLLFTCKSSTANVSVVGQQLQTLPAAFGIAGGGAGGVFIAGTNAATTVTTSLTTTFTGNLTGSVASVTGAVGSVTGAVGSVTGAVGSVTGSVGSVTGLTASNLDATITSRMATYAQPTGFLAATFPAGTVANTTNITAGTITTATNLTNAPTAGDFTATMKTSLGTAVGTAQTGDSYAIVNSGTFGNNALLTAIGTRMATYTQPTGFLAAAFPAGTIASTTNITAGTMTTTTNVTNAVNANITKVNNVTVNGDGAGTPWGP